ncbi:MAG: ABC transporter permease, partial [Pseudobdellovibrionaceae bacterium]
TDKSNLVNYGSYVYGDLELLLGLSVGETFTLGDLQLTVSGVVAKDSTQTFRAGGLAPRIFIHKNLLPESKLIQFGSTFTYSLLLKLKDSPKDSKQELAYVEEQRKKIAAQFPDPAVQVTTFKMAGEESARQLERLTDFMGLVSLVGVFLCALGAVYLIRADLNQRLKEFAIFKSLGMNRRKFYVYYFSFFSYLSVAVWIPTLIFTGVFLFGLNFLVQKFTNVDLQITFDLSTAVIALVTVFIGNLFICLPSIESINKVKASQLFAEGSFQQNLMSVQWYLFLPAILVFCALSVYQAQSWKTAGLFLLLLAFSILFLAGMGYLFIFYFLKKLKLKDWKLRHSIRSLERRKIQALSVFVALGLGVLLLNLLPQLRSTLMAELAVKDGSKVPSLFLFDIQEEQVEPFQSFISEKKQRISYLAPLVRSRLLKINNQTYERTEGTSAFQTREEESEARFRNRGVNLSYRSALTESESLVEGTFNGSVYNPEIPYVELSVEQRYADRMQIRLNDMLEFDVQGVLFTGKVTSIRTVKWTSFQPNFFVLLQPGVVDDAPKTYIASLSRMAESDRGLLQKELVEKFPNISAVDIDRTILEVLKTADQMSLSLQLMSWLCLVLGFVILISMIQSQVAERYYELNMLKIFGALYDQMKIYLSFEFVLLGFASAFFGSVASLVVSAILSLYLFERLHAFSMIWPLASLVGVSALTYFLSISVAKKVMREKPVTLLR